MNILLFGILAVYAVTSKAGILNQKSIVHGPSGVVTGAGAIGPKELDSGLNHGAASSVISYRYENDLDIGHRTAISNGGRTVSVSGHGAVVKGPNTVPVVIAGPASKIEADGLYGVNTHEHY